MGEAHGIHVHTLYQFHILQILLIRQRSSAFRTEAVAVHAAYVHLLAVDIQSVALASLHGAESEFVLFDMQRLAVLVDKRKVHLIAVRRLGSPELRVVHLECHVGMVAAMTYGGSVFSHLLAAHVADGSLHLSPLDGVVEQYIGIKLAVGSGVDSRALDVEGRLAYDENGAEDAAEVPVVGAPLGEVHAGIFALLAHGNLQQILLVAEEHAVGNVIRDTIEGAHVFRARLALVYLHLGVGHRSLENEFDMMVSPFLRQCELIFIHAFLVGNAVGECLAVEFHAILVSAESLQFPARRHSDFSPFPGVVSTRAEEVPLHHIVASVSAQILSVSEHVAVCSHCASGCSKQSKS